MIAKLDYKHYNIKNMKQVLEELLVNAKNEMSMLQITVDLDFTSEEENQILDEICNMLPLELSYTFKNYDSKQYTFRRI